MKLKNRNKSKGLILTKIVKIHFIKKTTDLLTWTKIVNFYSSLATVHSFIVYLSLLLTVVKSFNFVFKLKVSMMGDYGKFINPTVLLTVADDNINFAFIPYS